MRAFDFVRLTFIGVVVLFATFMLIRVLPAFRFILLLLLIVLLVVIFVVLIRRYFEEREAERAYDNTIAGQIEARIAICQKQIDRLQLEVEQIRKSIKELKAQLTKDRDVAENVRSKTESILKGFNQELDLRKTKINFYKQCIIKLKKILQQHELLATVERKKEELENLREKHFDEIADMEQLRLDVERDSTYLETIQDLSTRMENTTGTDEVLSLQKELNKMLAE